MVLTQGQAPAPGFAADCGGINLVGLKLTNCFYFNSLIYLLLYSYPFLTIEQDSKVGNNRVHKKKATY